MHHKEQPSCSNEMQIDSDLGGVYCRLKPLSLVNTTTQEPKLNRVTHTPRQDTQPCGSQPINNNGTSSPKRQVSRSISNPEHNYRNIEGVTSKPKQTSQAANHTQRNSGPFIVGPGRKSTGHVKIVGRKSTGSLSSREQVPPLCYFAYLGKLNPARHSQRPRGRLPSAHDILADRPVILTSATVVSTFATNAICREFEELEQNEKQCDYNEVLDCCTCMCCVKGLFYHCTKDSEDEGNLAEYPCSCQGPVTQCMGRWGIMGLLSIVMPCLLCYLPFEGCFRCYDCLKKIGNKENKKAHQVPESSSSSLDMAPTALSMRSNRYIDKP